MTVPTYSMGAMIQPIEREFGWSRADISAGPAIAAIAGVLLAPFMGMLIDRFGPRRVGLGGAMVVCIALALLSRTTDSVAIWWGLWLIVAIGTLFAQMTVWVSAVSTLFQSSRGLALAVVLCGSGLGSSVTPLLTYNLIELVGWRNAYIGLGALLALVVLPLIFFCFWGAADLQRVRPAPAHTAPPPVLSGLSGREGVRSAAFLRLALAGFTVSFVGTALVVNMLPLLQLSGIARPTAAGIASIIGMATIVGRLCGGVLIDRYNAGYVAAIAVAMPAAACALLLAWPGSVPVAIVAVILFGAGFGAELDAVAYLAGRHFGLRRFGLLFGTISGLMALGGGLGGLAASRVYDLLGSYDLVLMAMIPAGLAGTWLFALTANYTDRFFVRQGPVQRTAASSG